MVTSHEEILRVKTLSEKEVQNLLDNKDGRGKKLAGKLDVCRQQLRAVQDTLIEQGTTIANLEQQFAVLFLKPSHVSKPQGEFGCGDQK